MLGRQPLDEVLVGRAVGGVEGDDGDVQPGPGQLAGDDLVRPAGGEHDRSGGRSSAAPATMAWPMSLRAAEQHDGLRFAERVLHEVSGSVVEQPEPAALVAGPDAGRVDRARDRLPLGQSGVAPADGRRGRVRVLGQVVAAAGVEHDLVEPVEQLGQAAAAGRQVERQRPARDGERLSGPGLAAPKRLSTARKLAVPGRPAARRRCAALPPAPNGTTNWYCRKPAAPYSRFHEPTRVERVEERRDRADLADAAARRLAVPELVEGARPWRG